MRMFLSQALSHVRLRPYWYTTSSSSITSIFRRFQSTNKTKRIALAMSGGIDSTVAAITLKDQGYDVVGVYMRNWDSSDEAGTETCQIEKDREDMLSVCDHIGIKSHIVDFSKDYWNDVFVPFIEAYETGLITPNPDVYCNRHIKYDRFLCLKDPSM